MTLFRDLFKRKIKPNMMLVMIKKLENFFKIMLLFTLLSFNGLYSNYAFKKKVQNVCKSYRITIDISTFNFDDGVFCVHRTVDRFAVYLGEHRDRARAIIPGNYI